MPRFSARCHNTLRFQFRRRKHHHASSDLVHHRWFDRRVGCEIAHAHAHESYVDDRARDCRFNYRRTRDAHVLASETGRAISSGRDHRVDPRRTAGVVALAQIQTPHSRWINFSPPAIAKAMAWRAEITKFAEKNIRAGEMGSEFVPFAPLGKGFRLR